MNYPVDLNKKYVLFNKETQTAEKKKISWPRTDGMEVLGLDSKYVYLTYNANERPAISEGEELVATESADLELETYSVTYSKREKTLTPKQIFDKKIKDGYLVSPENFTLGLSNDDQNAFTRLLTLCSLAGMTDQMDVQISDKDGALKTLKLGRLKQILLSYGAYYQTIWADYKK